MGTQPTNGAKRAGRAALPGAAGSFPFAREGASPLRPLAVPAADARGA